MRVLVIYALLALPAWCQITIQGGVKIQGGVQIQSIVSLPPPGVGQPQLPINWVNNHESDSPYAATKYIGNTVGTCAANGGTCDYTCTDFSCLTQIMTDHCVSPSQRWLAVIVHGATFTDNGPLLLKACSTKQTAALVFDSDTPITAPAIPCVGGIQDNIAGSTDIYTRNQGCTTGTDASKLWNLTYTLNTNNGGSTNGIYPGPVDGSGNGPSWYVFRNMHIFSSVSGTHVSLPIQLNYNTLCTTLACYPSHIGFDRIYISGGSTDAGGASTTQIADYMDMDCVQCWVVNSNMDGGIWPGTESHGILVANSPGPIKVVHNVIEGESSGYFVGGLNHPGMPSLPALQDSEVRRNRFTYPAAWLGNGTGGGKCGAGGCVRKNGMEHKGVVREIVDGNIFENVDNSGAQSGPALNYNVRACSNSQACDDYNQTITDVTQTNNILRNMCRGVGWDGDTGNILAGVSVGLPMRRVLFQNNLLYNNGLFQPGCSNASTSVSMKVDASGHQFPNVTVTRNAGGTAATIQTYLGATVAISAISITSNVVSVTLGSALPQAPIGGSTWVTISGVPVSGYNGTFQTCTTPTSGCTVPTTTSFTYPLTASLASSSGGTAESFVGEAQSGMTTGDPVWVSGCVDTTFNAGPNPPVKATAATPTGTTVQYANVGAGNASTTCTFTSGIGFPQYLTLNHNTFITDLEGANPGTGSLAAQAAFSANNTYTNNIFAGQGWRADNATVEGTTTENGWWDTTTLVYHHNVQSDRQPLGTWAANTTYRIGDKVIPTASPLRMYVAVTSGTSGGSQPTFTNAQNVCITDNTVTWQNVNFQWPGTSGYTQYDTANTPISPVTDIFFPNYSYCYAATGSSACVGFVGGLSAPTTGTNSCTSGTQVSSSAIQGIFDLGTWTQYALDSSSSFHNAASDGLDMGVNVNSINTAETQTRYICTTYCGGGPFPD